MAFFTLLAIFAVSAGVAYSGIQSAKKAAKAAADSMAGVLVNKESNIEPIPVIYGERRVGGVRVFVSTKDVSGGDKNEYLYIALAMAEGEVESITDIYIDDTPITDSKFTGLYTINVHTGADNQAYDPLLTEANAGWSSDHKLSGIAYLAIKLKWDQDAFGGVPEITAVVKGRKVYDPSSGNTAYSNNPALCIRDYLTNNRYGKGLPASAIDDTAFIAAATDCEQSVTFYANGTTGKIFECNAVLQTDETLFDNIKTMLGGCRGFLPYNQGRYSLIIDKARSSVFAFDKETIIDGITIKGESKEDKFNRVIVKFANPDVDYQPDQAVWPDAGSTEETTFLAEDNGTLLVEDLSLDTVTNYYAARDLARVLLKRSRNALRTQFKATSEALQLSVGDVVTVTHETPAWSAKPFQVEEITLDYDGTCNVSLLEYDPSIYTYDLSAEQKSYPDTALPNPFSVAPPTSLVTSASTSVALDGTIVTSVEASWTASLDSFVSQYDVQWSTDNTNFESVVTDNVIFTVSPAIAGATYYFKVRAINSLGVKSSFVSANQGSAGDDIAPALPTSLSATAGYKSISLEWTNPSDKDFSNVEVYRATSSGGTFSLVASIGGGWGAATEFLNGGLADATAFFYKFKSVDYSGNKSDFTSEVTATTNAAAIDGTDGTSTFTAPIFRRSATTLSAPTGGTFNFGTNTLTAPTDWYTAVPSGTDPIYQATFQFSVSGDTGTVTAGTWSAPVIIAENGTNGTDGLSTFTFAVHKRASSAPSTPSGGSYNFTTNTITAPSDWSEAIPSGTDPVYISTTKAQISGATGTDSSLSWTAPVLFVQNGEDGQSITGATGPRNADGYLYYSVSQALAPDSPSATSYNFVTGSFGGLTDDWLTTPPTNTGGDAKYWATYWHVTEATFDGTQTRTFNTPFNSVQFDGLVTFANLDLELDNASSTKITTINGGLLKTGTIEGDRIRIDGVGIDVITNGTEKTLQIGDSGVTTVKIDALAVTEGKIADLAVDTLKIADQAVTIPSGSTTTAPAYTEWGSGSTETINGSTYYVPVLSSVAQWRTISSITFTSAGGNVFLTFSGELAAGVYTNDQEDTLGRTNIQFQILRDTTVIQTGFIKGNYVPVYGNLALSLNLNRMIDNYGNAVSISALDSTTSGSHTWSLRARPILQEANYDDFVAANRNFSVSALEVKK